MPVCGFSTSVSSTSKACSTTLSVRPGSARPWVRRYDSTPASHRPPVPYGAARLPHGNATQLETEEVLAEITTEGGGVTVLPELFWGKDVVLFEAEGPGARVNVPVRGGVVTAQAGDWVVRRVNGEVNEFAVVADSDFTDAHEEVHLYDLIGPRAAQFEI